MLQCALRVRSRVVWNGDCFLHFFCAGGDAGKQYRTTDWSCTVLGLRALDVLEGREMANAAWRPVCVVEGPGELKTWRWIMNELICGFVRHDPSRGVHRCQVRMIESDFVCPFFLTRLDVTVVVC